MRIALVLFVLLAALLSAGSSVTAAQPAPADPVVSAVRPPSAPADDGKRYL